MPAIGSCWGAGTWGDDCWGAGTWGSASAVQASADEGGRLAVLDRPPRVERPIPRLRPELPPAVDGTITIEVVNLQFQASGFIGVLAPPLLAVEGRIRLELGAGVLVEARGRSEDDEVGFLSWLARQLPPATKKPPS